MQLNGRKKIYTNYTEVTETNIGDILATSFAKFLNNQSQIRYLFKYYRGIQPILNRTKKVRTEINNKIVENHAYSIVQFKAGYLLERPIQVVARKDDVDNDSIIFLNDCFEMENKESKDKEIANDRAICGTAYRLVLPNGDYENDNGESPFNIYHIKPDIAFVVYSSDIGEKPLLGVVILIRRNPDTKTDEIILQAYTNDMFYRFNYSTLTVEEKTSHTMGVVPLIEYPNGTERIGSFEVVIPLLDAINTIQSNRVDGIEQFIQALLVFKNIEVTKAMLDKLKELGAIEVTDSGEVKANVEYLQQELNQTQVQTLKKDMLDVVYKICGIPTRNGSGSGDTGQATIMRDGWSEAEAKIQEDELSFRASEKNFLKLALDYMKTLSKGTYSLRLQDLQIKFTRRNYENAYQKAQILDLMLKNPKIAPRLAFETCGLFSDPEASYTESEEYYKSLPSKEQTNG